MSLGTLMPRRWSPAPRLDVDSLFDEFWRGFGTPSPFVAERGVYFVPQLDVSETEDAYRISAELPGLEEKDFEIVLEDNVLTLKGEKHDRHESEEGGTRRTETRHGAFERRIRFDGEIDQDAVKASYKHGILTVTVPKPEEAKPHVRSIPVESA